MGGLGVVNRQHTLKMDSVMMEIIMKASIDYYSAYYVNLGYFKVA